MNAGYVCAERRSKRRLLLPILLWLAELPSREDFKLHPNHSCRMNFADPN